MFNPQSGTYYGSALAAPVFKDIADMMYAKEFFKSDIEKKEVSDSSLPASKDGYQSEITQVFKDLGMKYSSASQDASWIFTETGKTQVQVQAKNIKKNLMPYVVGMGLKDAIYLLEAQGLQVKKSGHGTVKKQSIKSGTNLANISSVSIEMSHKN